MPTTFYIFSHTYCMFCHILAWRLYAYTYAGTIVLFVFGTCFVDSAPLLLYLQTAGTATSCCLPPYAGATWLPWTTDSHEPYKPVILHHHILMPHTTCLISYLFHLGHCLYGILDCPLHYHNIATFTVFMWIAIWCICTCWPSPYVYTLNI